MKMRRSLAAALVLAACTTLAACTVPAYRSASDLTTRAAAIKTISLAPPKVEVVELGVGSSEKVDEWSVQGAKNVAAAVTAALSRRGSLRVNPVVEESLADDVKAQLKEVNLLFDVVNGEVLLHTYGIEQERFSEKLTAFDYSLGPSVKALNTHQADALVFIRAYDQISTKGRVAAQVAMVLVAAAMGVAVVPQTGQTTLSIALVDATSGALLWHKFLGGPGYDLREIDSANRIIEQALKDFPIR